MDFGWTSEQQALYDRAVQFSRSQLSTAGAEKDAAGFPRALWRKAGEFGFLGLSVPTEYGGLGLPALDTARLIEALGRGCDDAGFVFSISAHLFACVMPILESGSEAQKAELLPRLCSGEWVAANAITEAEAGSDVFALRSRAVKDGDRYLLTGTKSYVTNGPTADVFLAYAVTQPEHGYLGISAFVVPRSAERIQVGAPFEKQGLQTSPISSVYFDETPVPASLRLGAEGAGAAVFKRSMLWERACLFAGYLGIMERTLEQSVSFARQRRQFGKPIGKNQAISHRLVDMKQRLEAARLLLYRACWKMDRGEDATLEVALSKLAISEGAVQSALDAIQIHGGMGYLVETGIEKVLRDAVPTTLFSGTSEMQRDIAASRLGL